MNVRFDGLGFVPAAVLSGIAIALIGLARMVQVVDNTLDTDDDHRPRSLPLHH